MTTESVLHLKWVDLNRLRKILVVIFLSGGGVLLELLRIRYLVPLRYRLLSLVKRRIKDQPLLTMKEGLLSLSPDQLRQLFEKLGPTFIKLGQVLSLRADLVGEEISSELSKLQSGAPSYPYEDVRRVFFEETGKYPDDLFQSFEPEPVAAASLAQVHRARLKDGTPVAVKVQRPGIRKTIEQDVHILYYLAGLMERFISEVRVYQPKKVVQEFSDWTFRELDFTSEGKNADRFRYIFRENPNIYIPKIYWEQTTPRILTMDFSTGCKIDDREKMRAMGVDPKRLAQIGVDALFRQFFVSGFFHADPHPGNFFAMPDGRLCLHDFGMVGYLNPSNCRELLSCLVSFVNKDIEGYTRHLLHLAETGDQSNISGFEKDVSNILSEFFFSQSQTSAAWAFFRVINRGGRNGIRFPVDLALFGKALVTTEAMGKKLYPEFDFNRELEPFVRKTLLARMNPIAALKTIETDFLDLVGAVRNIPEQVQAVLSKVTKGEIGVKLDPGDLLGIKREFDRQNDLRILGIVLTAVFFSTFGLLYREGKTTLLGFPLSTLGIGLFIFLFGWFLFLLRKGPRR